MTGFTEGQRVKVEYEAEIVAIHDDIDNGRMVVKTGGKNVWVNPDVAKVTVLDPPGWPPQVGDIWQDFDGNEWYIRDSKVPGEGPFAVPVDGDSDLSMRQFKALNLRLVRRRGE